MVRRIWTLALIIVLVMLLSGCSASSDTDTFSMVVIPEEIRGNAVVGQKVIYLVYFADNKGDGPIHITATGNHCTVEITPEDANNEVVEIYITPLAASEGSMISVDIKAERNGYEETESVTFEVVPGEVDDRLEKATEVKAMFIAWLAENMPELGITEDTVWEGTTVSPQWLVVSHYLFISEEWEMHVSWHIMIAPYDWAKIDLRKRFDESTPSYAFEIASITATDEPVAAELPSEAWR